MTATHTENICLQLAAHDFTMLAGGCGETIGWENTKSIPQTQRPPGVYKTEGKL